MSRDPSQPFVGMSAFLDWANPISGTPFADYGDAIRYRADSSTVTAGESFLAGFYDESGLAAGDVVVAQVVVVCGAGSSGSLRISIGTDPGWSLTNPALASTALGTFAVSGEQDVVSDAWTGFDLDAYLAQDEETIAFVECLSGSVVIEQVKLRLWPVGGAAGGWSDPLSGFTTSYALPSITGGDQTSALVESASGDPEAMWDATMGALPGSEGVTGPLALGGSNYGLLSAGGNAWAYAVPAQEAIIDIVYSLSGVNAVVKAQSSGGVAVLAGPPPTFTYPGPGPVEGVDFFYPPDEVADDDSVSWVQPVGSVGYVWENTTATVATGPDASDPLPIFGLTVASETTGTDPILSGGSFLDRNLDAGGTIVNETAATTYTPVSLTAVDRWVIVYVWSSLAVTPPPWPEVAPLAGDSRSWVADGVLHFGQGVPGVTFAPMRVALVMPPYRVWSLTPARVPPLRQRNRGRVRSRLHADRQRSIRSRGFL